VVVQKAVELSIESFATSEIIRFWERFYLKHCKKKSKLRELQNPAISSETFALKAQKIGSNITSWLFVLLIAFVISILGFLEERFFYLTYE
jgi:hypothetical protein